MPSTSVFAPVKGTIGRINVAEGQTVGVGEAIMVQYSAKTESNVAATASGRVKLLVQQGSEVNQGDRVAEIES